MFKLNFKTLNFKTFTPIFASFKINPVYEL